jgi:murein DD-endopeptidase MepM/ murein hydrolase activator NlpD
MALGGISVANSVEAEEPNNGGRFEQGGESRGPQAPADVETHGTVAESVTTRFRIPLRGADWHWAAYADVDPTTGDLDFDCQSETYDGHSGVDIGILDFVTQEEGRFVLAAASGTVLNTRDGYPDRETSGQGKPDNFIYVRHEDGSVSGYGHHKTWSTLVTSGQQVFEGQSLALVGSSGTSTAPHLHFGVYDENEIYQVLQDGPCSPGDRLWKEPVTHYSYFPTDLAINGLTSLSPSAHWLKERPPDILHYEQTSSTSVRYWFRYRYIKPGTTSRIVVRDPSGSVYTSWDKTHNVLQGMKADSFSWTMPATGSTGLWTVEHELNGVRVAERTFTYDGVSDQIPEAQGRTVVVAHGTAGAALHGSDADGGIKEFRLVSPPMNGRVVLEGPRQKYFRYVPATGFEGQDSFEFEVLDALDQSSLAETITLDVSPVMASTLHLEGDDDHIAVPDNGSLNLTQALTLEAWIRRTTGSAWHEVLFNRRVGFADDRTGFSFGLRASGPLRLQVGDGSNPTYAYSISPIPMHEWTHVAATWDGQHLRIYVNGKLDGPPVPFTGPINYGTFTFDTLLGRSDAGSPGDSFRGEIDEMRIWSEARSEAQLAETSPCELLTAPPPTLVGWWRMRSDALDASGHGNHGTLVGPGAYFLQEDGGVEFCASEDIDGDSIDDVADNCPLTPNVVQADGDGDGFGDACDLCPSIPGRVRADFDRDGVGDACDVCPFLADTDQLDSDGDGSGDLCDPAPSVAGSGVPVTPLTLTLAHDAGAGTTTLNWNADAVAESYQVVRGSPEMIRARFYGPCVSSGDPDPTDTTYVDGDEPAPGELFGYVIVGVGANGVQGLGGLDSEGRQRDMRAKDCL